MIEAVYNKQGRGRMSSNLKVLEWRYWGRNTLDPLYLKTSLWSSHLWRHDPKAMQPAFTRQILKDVSYKYETVFFIRWPLVNFHINRGDFLLKIRGGPWSMDRVHWPAGPCFVYMYVHFEGTSLRSSSCNLYAFQVYECYQKSSYETRTVANLGNIMMLYIYCCLTVNLELWRQWLYISLRLPTIL